MYNHGQSSKEFTIQSDGSFEVDTSLLNKDDLVVFVVNSTSKTIFGHLNLEASNDEKLELLDASKMEKDLELGEVNSADNCSSEETLYTTTSFKSSELDNLQKISRNDDALALYSNNWRNPTIASYISTFFTVGSFSNLSDNYSNVDNFSQTNNFIGMGPLFYINSKLDNVSSLYLYPPSPIKNSLYNKASNDLTPDNLSFDSNSTTPITINSVNWSTSSLVTSIYSPNVDSFPSGDWKLTHTDNTSLGNLQFVGSDPFDNASTFKAFIPSIKVNKDSSGKLTSVNMKLYSESASGNKEIIDASYFDTIAYNDFCVYILNDGQSESSSLWKVEISGTSTEWEYTAPVDVQVSAILRIVCNYKIGQSKFSFFYE